MDATTLSLEAIAQRLKARKLSTQTEDADDILEDYTGIFYEPAKSAAVLIPLLIQYNAWQILFTRRTDNLVKHSGQVSFPGGSFEPQDASVEQTALREAHEEIGLHPQDVNILGALPKILTITNYWVTPVVGTIPWPYPFVLETREVKRIFTIPLVWLADPANYQVVERHLIPTLPRIATIVYKPYDNEVLWGVSARIIQNLLNTLFPNKKSRPVNNKTG